MKKLFASALVGTALLAVACGGGSKSPTSSGGQSSGGAGCAPNGTTVQESAKGTRYTRSCIAAPGNTAFTIEFDNQDAGLTHNMEIFSDTAMTQSVFKGEIVTGPKTVSYSVSALAPGTYHFHCDIHPSQMQGTLIVK